MAEPFDFLAAALSGPQVRPSRRPRRSGRLGEIYVEGLDVVTLNAAAEGKNVRRKLQSRIRRLARPMVDDARKRFNDLPGTGPRVAKTVRLQFRGDAVALSFGGQPWAFGREFGAKRNWTRSHVATVGWRGRGGRKVIAREVGYADPDKRIFGPWTGNQFQLGTTGARLSVQQVSGRAFYPSIAEHVERIDEALQALVAEELRKISGGQ